jgi:NAD+ kinase
VKRVLIVFKRSFLQQQRHDASFLRGVDPATRRRVIRGDRENHRALLDVIGAVARARARADIVYRGELGRPRGYDLVVTVGGDGTLLSTAHRLTRTPVLAVNSDPEHSLGLFAGADRRTFEERLRAALEGRLPRLRLHRLRVRLNGRPLAEPVLNEVLFSRLNPASMSRYRLRLDGLTEEQRSSGLWISTAAGSTAAIRAAGGRRLPIESPLLQVVVREPYRGGRSSYRLTRGVSPGPVWLQPLVAGMALWIDGDQVSYPLRYGDRVTIDAGAPPLVVLGHDDARRRRLFP